MFLTRVTAGAKAFRRSDTLELARFSFYWKTLKARMSPALPYVTSDFHVLAVGGHKFLSAEIAEFASKGGFQVEASDYVVEDSELTLFSQTNNEWTGNLERKLKKLPALTEDSERRDYQTGC